MRRRLIHCESRTPFYFQARFARIPPQDLEDHQKKLKGNPKLIGPTNQRINRNLTTRRPISLTDQNKTAKTGFTSVFLDKDNPITKTRHTT